ncbi:OLC1v1014227C1 [Oldenlandia corymbosa var. corymbosa]|uniref:OLC1v1014227C1 n=1 Tax=Oldenlandia corymbosa var. corymbosa TaxID=529605 RepID=A0AAV1E2D7_OLDCO|nr:OLC1v1014227C1 [Oldenlandia corymbosa var. corymbosa]
MGRPKSTGSNLKFLLGCADNLGIGLSRMWLFPWSKNSVEVEPADFALVDIDGALLLVLVEKRAPSQVEEEERLLAGFLEAEEMLVPETDVDQKKLVVASGEHHQLDLGLSFEEVKPPPASSMTLLIDDVDGEFVLADCDHQWLSRAEEDMHGQVISVSYRRGSPTGHKSKGELQMDQADSSVGLHNVFDHASLDLQNVSDNDDVPTEDIDCEGFNNFGDHLETVPLTLLTDPELDGGMSQILITVEWLPSGPDPVSDDPRTIYSSWIQYRDIIEPYLPNRVLRQIGYIQVIPPPIPHPLSANRSVGLPIVRTSPGTNTKAYVKPKEDDLMDVAVALFKTGGGTL